MTTLIMRNQSRDWFTLAVNRFRAQVMFLNRRLDECGVASLGYINLN